MFRYSVGVCWVCPCAVSAGRKSDGADRLLLNRQKRHLEGGRRCYPRTRGSFLILSFTPWSPKERERKVDSDIPGKARGVNTDSCQLGHETLLEKLLTSERS